MCVDKIHLFIQYELSFREKFALLSNVMVNYIKLTIDNCTTVPVLFMTATYTIGIFEQAQLLKVLYLYKDKQNVF